MKLKARIPAVVLGIPLSESENPFISAPIGSLEAVVEVSECGTPGIRVEGPHEQVHSLLAGFFDSLTEVLPGLCISLTYRIIEGSATRAGIYATLTTLLVHAVARYHGETLDEWELVELARNADPLDKPWGWGYVLDSLRYMVATGKIVVFRNDEEFAALREIENLKVSVLGEVGPLTQKLVRDDVGPDPYNATIHLVGVTVLEGAVRIQEGGDPVSDLLPLAKILSGVASAYWSLPMPEEKCIYSPGIPGFFNKLCF